VNPTDTMPETAEVPPRPVAIPFNVDAIPDELKALPRWVAWRYKWKEKERRWTKVPVNPRNGQNASDTNPTTWGTLDEAISRSRFPGMDGIGFMLGSGFIGIDLDDCIDENGELSPLAKETVERFATYTEVSPSGTGLKLIFHAGLTAFPNGKPGTRRDELGIEAYSAARYFALTGKRLRQEGIETRDEALNWFIHAHLTKPKRPAKPRPATQSESTPSLEDQKIIDLLFRAKNGGKAQKLWDGDANDYKKKDGTPDYSRAESALCCMVAFYTRDAGQIERIVSQSTLVNRDKWRERSDYRTMTIAGALETVSEQYQPHIKVKMTGAGRMPQPSANGTGHQEAPPPNRGSDATSTPLVSDAKGALIILEYFRQLYKPVFRRGNTIHCKDGREVPMGEACAVANSNLINRLEFASDAPTIGKTQVVNRGALPGFFRTWGKVSWGDLMLELPDEDTAELGENAPARDEFRRLVASALLTEVVLGTAIRGKGDDHAVTEVERRPLIDWCRRFAKTGTWRDIRGKRCWCRVKDVAGPAEGEIQTQMQVAIRHEVFSQLRADRRLCEMGSNIFTRRAAKYGVGKSGERKNRPHGWSAIVLDAEFVAELTDQLPEDDDNNETTNTE
jgi:hypothetical protein